VRSRHAGADAANKLVKIHALLPWIESDADVGPHHPVAIEVHRPVTPIERAGIVVADVDTHSTRPMFDKPFRQETK
jgi:hypothetical protein